MSKKINWKQIFTKQYYIAGVEYLIVLICFVWVAALAAILL